MKIRFVPVWLLIQTIGLINSPVTARNCNCRASVSDATVGEASHRDALQFETLLPELVEIFHERHGSAVEALDFRVRRFDDVIFVGRVRAAAVPETEMS